MTVSAEPAARSSRVSVDGLHVAFTSAASPTPTGYDNLDAKNDGPDEEAYLYDASTGKLRCVSCNPTGARPAGEEHETVWVSARLANQRIPLHAPRSLSDDGRRLFFESHEALVPTDTNGTWDVYEWEEAGKGSCTISLPTYDEASEGCIELISSGQSPADSRFLDADPSGANVFFATQSSLIAADYGLTDVYDARVDGGLPEPTLGGAECEGEACQSPPPPPPEQTPASSAFHGPANPGAKCPRGKRKVHRHGKASCVRKRTYHRRHRRHGGTQR
jgi:hypothetical protein